ncbi:FecR family protein [Flavobacterium limi]|uniref:FecR family protein n=1 Tax=Flavobacterium limi TaxID=2045105 RepID=A0ABQ1TT72_9FLAO|nr:FecR domain-containing protein [Flavobacterium limi]GGF00637.1 hypothetical protein GCM10011518_07570 [Flavobacterium limi]
MKEDHYLSRLLSNDLSEEEKQALGKDIDWQMFEKIKEHSGQLNVSQRESGNMLQTVLAAPKKKSLFQTPSFQWMAAAAMLLLFTGIGFLFLGDSQTSIYAARGTEKTFLFPDGSQVSLNSDSEISFNKSDWKENRTLSLTGEAYFKVVKGSKFSVLTSNGIVQVLGTQFNVRSRSQRIDVACYEGRVRVSEKNKEQIVIPGKMVTINKGSWLVNKINVNQPEWTANQIIFRADLLNEVTAELERKYNIKIKVSKVNTTKEYTGTVPADNLDIALKIIEETFNLKRTQFTDGNYELMKK